MCEACKEGAEDLSPKSDNMREFLGQATGSPKCVVKCFEWVIYTLRESVVWRG